MTRVSWTRAGSVAKFVVVDGFAGASFPPLPRALLRFVDHAKMSYGVPKSLLRFSKFPFVPKD